MEKKYCLHCTKEIEIKPTDKIGDFKRKKFCNQSCAASFNNKKVRKRKKVIYYCLCGNTKDRLSKHCRKCNTKALSSTYHLRTLGEIVEGKAYTSTLLGEVRRGAKKVLSLSGKEKRCLFCNTDEFLQVLEVCHIRGIMTFPMTAKVEEINHPDNLIWLCPSHHAMFDKGLLNTPH